MGHISEIAQVFTDEQISRHKAVRNVMLNTIWANTRTKGITIIASREEFLKENNVSTVKEYFESKGVLADIGDDSYGYTLNTERS